MTEISFISAFLVGIAGSVHCVGMCGGVVTAFSFATGADLNKAAYALAYNLGRVTCYTLLGALTGFFGQIASAANSTEFPVLTAISGFFLILLALYISNWWRVLTHLESAGRMIWKRVQPLSKKLLPVNSLPAAAAYGAIWGLLPCGLVYSALTWSLASGSPVDGAILMLGFGLGTLPSLIAVHFGAKSVLAIMQHRVTRQLVALLLALSGIFLLFKVFQSIVI